MFRYNKNVERRNEIIGMNTKEGIGGIVRFKNLSFDQVKQLMEEKFLNPDDQQNSAPTCGEFFSLISKHPQMRAHGYAVTPNREDYRVSIEGVEFRGLITEEIKDSIIKYELNDADVFELSIREGYLYCWWD